LPCFLCLLVACTTADRDNPFDPGAGEEIYQKPALMACLVDGVCQQKPALDASCAVGWPSVNLATEQFSASTQAAADSLCAAAIYEAKGYVSCKETMGSSITCLIPEKNPKSCEEFGKSIADIETIPEDSPGSTTNCEASIK
jgi:hypothetical protein